MKTNIPKKLFTRQSHPDFLDLPWDEPLAKWQNICDRIVEIERGRSRHEVLFVVYGKRIYAVKELPGNNTGEHEYRILRELERQELPAVIPVGFVELNERSVVITEYLDKSLPYRSLFLHKELFEYQEYLFEALAVLLCQLHLKGIYWGDVSLSNVLFRRDAGYLNAYLVDAETSEIHSLINDSKRDYELVIMEENITGELMDISMIQRLPESIDLFEVGSIIRRKYDDLWKKLTQEEYFDKKETYRIHERVRLINELGFNVDEIELIPVGDGKCVKLKVKVTDRNFYQDKLHNLTGIKTEKYIAKYLLNEIKNIKRELTRKEKRNIPIDSAAFYWIYEIYFPVIKQLGLMYNSNLAPNLYCEILEHKWYLSEKAKNDIAFTNAIEDYKKSILSRRSKFRIFTTKSFSRHIVDHTQEVRKYIHTLSDEWKKRIFYILVPRSFKDSTGDSIGDLQGVISKLDYLKWLGIDTLLFTPIYPSPKVDFGFDIIDYTDIDPDIGYLTDFDELVTKAHEKGIKIILNYVPSYTSDQHSWFLESRSSHDNPHRDWYYWRDPDEDGGPPNNWLSFTCGSAWTWDEHTKQYYLSSFMPEMPDLNWSNPSVRSAMLDILRFWLDRGVDGFRTDVISWTAKDEKLRDEPLNPNYDPELDLPFSSLSHIYIGGQSELFEYLKEIRQVLNEYENRVVIGALDIFTPKNKLTKYYGSTDLIDMSANFRFAFLPFEAKATQNFVDTYNGSLPDHAWPNYQLSSHDYSRIVTRYGKKQSRVAAMLLLTLRGTPFIYYGDEIGMHDVDIPPEEVQDPWEKTEPGTGRDPNRTPMQWNTSKNAGFTTANIPWLPIAEDYKKINVEIEMKDPHSILQLYHNLIQLRCKFPSLTLGNYYSEIENIPEDCFVYHRQFDNYHHLIVLNFSSEQKTISHPLLSGREIILSTFLDRKGILKTNSIILRGKEGCIVEIESGNK